MILKLIIIAAVAVALYRLAGGTLLPKRRDEKISPDEKAEEETLVECDRCSTYVVKKEAIFFKGKYYCSRECLPR